MSIGVEVAVLELLRSENWFLYMDLIFILMQFFLAIFSLWSSNVSRFLETACRARFRISETAWNDIEECLYRSEAFQVCLKRLQGHVSEFLKRFEVPPACLKRLAGTRFRISETVSRVSRFLETACRSAFQNFWNGLKRHRASPSP